MNSLIKRVCLAFTLSTLFIPAVQAVLPPSPPTAPLNSPPEVAARLDYLHPGILVQVGGKWEGSDHLLNIANRMGVYVSLLKPENDSFNTTAEQLQKGVEKIFQSAGIQTQTLIPPSMPPLPAFEVQIFLYPITGGYTAFCSGRLFEGVTLNRVKLTSHMAFQAITWEKQLLIVGPKDTFAEQLDQAVKEISEAFIDRVKRYASLTPTTR